MLVGVHRRIRHEKTHLRSQVVQVTSALRKERVWSLCRPCVLAPGRPGFVQDPPNPGWAIVCGSSTSPRLESPPELEGDWSARLSCSCTAAAASGIARDRSCPQNQHLACGSAGTLWTRSRRRHCLQTIRCGHTCGLGRTHHILTLPCIIIEKTIHNLPVALLNHVLLDDKPTRMRLTQTCEREIPGSE